MFSKVKVLIALASDINTLITDIINSRSKDSPGGADIIQAEQARIVADLDRLVAKAKSLL